jgi:hypothetical protein
MFIITATLKLNKINDYILIKYLIDSIIFTFGHGRYVYGPIDPSSHGTGRILNHTHNFTTITLCVHMGHIKLDKFKHS